MKYMKWEDEEIELLKERFLVEKTKNDVMRFFPYRDWDSIRKKAYKLNLKRNFCRKSNLSILLKEKPESYYWIGFILADGYIRNRKEIQIHISKNDAKHIINFSKYVEHEGSFDKRKNTFGLHIGDMNIVKEICQKFDIKERKTYNPPDRFIKASDALIKSFIVGFIDGDGNINKPKNKTTTDIKIKCHGSWLNFLDWIANYLKLNNKALLNKKGYAVLNICDFVKQKDLKKNAINNNLPFLERKWNKIDLDYTTNRE